MSLSLADLSLSGRLHPNIVWKGSKLPLTQDPTQGPTQVPTQEYRPESVLVPMVTLALTVPGGNAKKKQPVNGTLYFCQYLFFKKLVLSFFFLFLLFYCSDCFAYIWNIIYCFRDFE